MIPFRGSLTPWLDNLTENWSDESSLLPHSITNDDGVGDALPSTKCPGTTRLYFTNINGISYGALGGDFIDVCGITRDNGIDILGIAETKLDTTQRTLRKCATRSFATSHHKVIMASSEISYDSPTKPGGTLLLSQGHITGRIVSTSADDMGRWCTSTYSGKDNKFVTVISAYQVCKGSPTANTTAGGATQKHKTITQQYTMMVKRGINPARHPRKQFILDLTNLVTQLRAENHSIILMGDFNEEYDSEPDSLPRVAAAGGLVDLMQERLGHSFFKTHIDGSKRIDYVLVSPNIMEACQAAGYDAFKTRFSKSDHRGFFMDLKTSILFGNETATLAPPTKRILESKHLQNRITYITKKIKFLEDRKWFERLKQADSGPISPSEIAHLLEQLDRDWTRASLHAEKQCIRHKQPPYVRRLDELRKQKKVLEVCISAQRWGVPLKTAMDIALQECTTIIPNNLEDQKQLLTQVKREMRQIEKNADKHRKDEQQAAADARKLAGDMIGAKAIRNIMIAEEMKQMWRKLRCLSGTSDQGVSKVQIPRNGDFTSCKECTEWVNVEEPKEIEQALIRRNQIHFGQAQGTFPTVRPFSEKLNWAAGTYEAELILEGKHNQAFADHEIDDMSKLLLQHFEATTALDSITSELTEDDWEGKLKVWKESTTTSPSGLHLGHYKSIAKPICVPDNPEVTKSLEELRGKLLTAQVQLTNLAIRHGHVYQRRKSQIS